MNFNRTHEYAITYMQMRTIRHNILLYKLDQIINISKFDSEWE